MTSNQIEYWKLQELKRANLINEQQARAMLDESRRHSMAMEEIERGKLNATNQSNLLTQLANAETVRKNRANEKIQYATIGSNQRIAEVNARNYRDNMANALLMAQMNADTSRYVAQTNYAGTVYASNNAYKGTTYSADKNYAGTTYSANSAANTATYNRALQADQFSQTHAETVRHNQAMEQAQLWGTVATQAAKVGKYVVGVIK